MSTAEFLWLRREVEKLRAEVDELKAAKPSAVVPALLAPPSRTPQPSEAFMSKVNEALDKRTKAWRDRNKEEV